MIDNNQQDLRRPPTGLPVLKRIPPSAILNWLHAGVSDTRHAGMASLFYGASFALVGLLLYAVFAEYYALFAALTTGFLLLGPFLAMGLYDLSRRIEMGKPVNLLPSLTAWQSNMMNVGIFAGLLVVVLMIWSRASLVVFALYFEGGLPTFNDIVLNVITFKQPLFTLVYFAVGGFFAAFVFAISVVSIPLMADRQTDAITAGLTSIRVCMKNPLSMLLWGFCIVVLVGFGFATSFLGLIVAMPVIGHATWHVYRDALAAVDA
ncbi:COG5473 Predicted integral membrane protein [Methylophilaceae bacterium]